MDDIIKQIQDVAEGQIDFTGQKVTEWMSTIMLIAFTFIGLVVGLSQNDIHLTMWICLAGTAITLLAVVPPWPSFNKNPQSWVGSRTKVVHGNIVVQGIKVQ